jgi:hypothetical protein
MQSEISAGQLPRVQVFSECLDQWENTFKFKNNLTMLSV